MKTSRARIRNPRNSRYRNLVIENLSGGDTDLATDCIGELFARNEEEKFWQLQRYISKYNLPIFTALPVLYNRSSFKSFLPC